jgi:hypothetical protein
MMTRSSLRYLVVPTFVRRLASALVFLFSTGFAAARDAPLKVAVYDAPSVDGVSVDLRRRAAESLGRQYHLVPVAQMETS